MLDLFPRQISLQLTGSIPLRSVVMTAAAPPDPLVWYILKQPQGTCELHSQPAEEPKPDREQVWGPFESREEAIARRVGLIRSGKCLPV